MNDKLKHLEDKVIANEKHIIENEKKFVDKLSRGKQAVFDKFPIVFTMLGSFGLVATFYGFERLIDKIELFTENPWILLGTGVGTLLFTGTLYKKLQ